MAVTTEISWGDGTSDKIYLTRNASEGNQTVLVSSDANTGAARSKVVTFSASGASPVTLTVSQAAGEPLPYDAEVEYLESAGTGAYIDSGIECTGDLSVELRAYWFNTNNTAICGGIKSNGGSSYFRHHMYPRYSSAQSLYWYQNNSSTGPSISGRAGSPNYWHTFKLNADTGAWDLDNGTISGTVTTVSSSITTGKSYGIFARISNDGSLQSKGARFSWIKLSRGGVLLRDFIPVRVGTTGYLYDKVSKQLFGNAGSGSFTYGNDKQ